MRLALATCSLLPDWEVDDRPLREALRGMGAAIDEPAWDDPTVDWSGYDACLIRTTWDYMERRDAYVEWAARAGARTRLFNSAEVVRWNTHKGYLRQLEAEGVSIVPTVWLEAGAGAPAIADLVGERGWRRAFLKPMIGASARETLRFSADREGLRAAQAHADRLLPIEGLMLQPYLDGVERDGEVSAIFVDGELAHGVQKIPVAGDYRVQDDYGARDLPYRFECGELEVARSTIAAAARVLGDGENPLLYARADFLRGLDGGLLLTELELVEPSLFFRHAPRSADLLARAFVARLR